MNAFVLIIMTWMGPADGVPMQVSQTQMPSMDICEQAKPMLEAGTKVLFESFSEAASGQKQPFTVKGECRTVTVPPRKS